jgi:glycosyltransferase involved in cell wall biosynthesis
VFWGAWPVKLAKERYYGWAMRRYARLVICVSAVIQDEMVNRFGVPRARTAYLPSAVDLSELRELAPGEREAIREPLGVARGDHMLLNVGRINKQKGQDLLVEAFRRLQPRERNVKLVLVGGVSQDAQQGEMQRFRDQLVARVREHGLQERVVFAGWRDDVPALLAASDGYVHASRWEGFGMASFEAMAAACPTIWTNCWGRPDGFIDDVHGWLVPTEDAEALRAAMEKLLALSAQQRQEMGRAARGFVEARYDVRPIADRFASLVETAALGG